MSQFKSPLKVPSPRKSLENPTTFVMEGDNVLPLTHSVSFYRKQQSQVRIIGRSPMQMIIITFISRLIKLQ